MCIAYASHTESTPIPHARHTWSGAWDRFRSTRPFLPSTCIIHLHSKFSMTSRTMGPDNMTWVKICTNISRNMSAYKRPNTFERKDSQKSSDRTSDQGSYTSNGCHVTTHHITSHHIA